MTYTNGFNAKKCIPSHSPHTYNNSSWHVRELNTYGFEVEGLSRTIAAATTDTAAAAAAGAAASETKEGPACCNCWRNSPTSHNTMRYSNGSQYASNVAGTYGVYHESGFRSEEDHDGFVPRTTNTYRNANSDPNGPCPLPVSGHTRNNAVPETSQAEADSCGWCVAPTDNGPSSNEDSCWASWCKPTILLLILVLLVVVFVLVSGILLYFNCMFLSACLDLAMLC